MKKFSMIFVFVALSSLWLYPNWEMKLVAGDLSYVFKETKENEVKQNSVKEEKHHLEQSIFEYVLESCHDDKLCRHIGGILNTTSSEIWVSEPFKIMLVSPKTGYVTSSKTNPSYEENGIYAFTKLPGIAHNAQFTYRMRRSKIPTSTEFDSIIWRE